MADGVGGLNSFTHLKTDIDKQAGWFDRLRKKHVRYTGEKGVYLHKGLSLGSRGARIAKRRAAGEQIYKAIAFEHSAETAKRVFREVLGSEAKNQTITLNQLDQIAAKLDAIKAASTRALSPSANLNESQQIGRLSMRAKSALQNNDRELYSVVLKEIRRAPTNVRNGVIQELKRYDRAMALHMRATIEKNLADKGLALCSEAESIVRTRTVNLLKILDPQYRGYPLTRRDDAIHDETNTMGALRNEFNRQNVHSHVRGKAASQGMQSADPPEFIPVRENCFHVQHEMIDRLGTQQGKPELLMQTFFMPWEDTKFNKETSKSSDKRMHRQDEGLDFLYKVRDVAQQRALNGLPPMKVKILINQPTNYKDDRSPGKHQRIKKLREIVQTINTRGADVEIWGGQAPYRDSYHKKMTVALGQDGTPERDSGVLVLSGNHDTQTMLDSGVLLTGRNPAVQQRKQFYKETAKSGKLIARNNRQDSRDRVEQRSRAQMELALDRDPPVNDRNAGNSLMTHQPPNATLKNQFRLSEPYTLMKAGLRSAKSKVRIVMPYFQLLDLRDEIKGALARGVDVDLVLGYDQGAQQTFGQSNRESAQELADFRDAIAGYNGDNNVGKLKIGWFEPPRTQNQYKNDADPRFNPKGAGYPHQKYMSVDNNVTIFGSFNADYQSLHSAEQMVAVPSDDNSRQFFDYASNTTIPLANPTRYANPGLGWAQRKMANYVGAQNYQRLGINSQSSNDLPPNLSHPGGNVRVQSWDADDGSPNAAQTIAEQQRYVGRNRAYDNVEEEQDIQNANLPNPADDPVISSDDENEIHESRNLNRLNTNDSVISADEP